LAIGPLISALAAGNCAILKPSELSPHTATLIRTLLSDTFPESEVCVFEGDYQVAQNLLEKPFHHIFFTGSPAVGKIIMAAAAKNLAS
jgi:aldehyde dehydrogenase (NAD+)